MISSRIQYELNKHPDLVPDEIMLGPESFDDLRKEIEIEELRKIDLAESLSYNGIKVTMNRAVEESVVKIFWLDNFGLNRFFKSLALMSDAFQDLNASMSKVTPLAIISQRYVDQKDFDENYSLLNDVPDDKQKPFIEMLKVGFDIRSAIRTLEESF